VVRLTLAYNPGAATGITLGEYSRLVFSCAAVVAVLALAHLYRRTDPRNWPTALALSLVMAGAIGNLLDRIRSPRGVVDFIDLGIGSVRFWTFNVADVGVSVGALLLAWQLAALNRAESEGEPHPEGTS
jgi:signal peptidase II